MLIGLDGAGFSMRSIVGVGTRIRVAAIASALLLGTLLALPAVGLQTSLRVPLDLDNDSATGCSVELQDPASPSGTTIFEGAEFTVHASVDAFPDPPITRGVQLEDCPAIGALPSFVDLDSDLEVATNQGHKGSDAIPVYVLLESLGASGVVRLAVEATSESGSSDLLLETGGQPVTFDLDGLGTGLPGLGETGLLMLGLALLLLGLAGSRQRARKAGIACGLLLLLLLGFRGGPAWSNATFTALFDEGDLVALDELGDSKYGDSAADLVALWVVAAGDSLVLRVDVDNVEIARCRGTNAPGDPNCDGVCDPSDDTSSPDCDDICDAQEPVGSPDCDSYCANTDAAGSPDCDGNCDPGDAAGSTDCDGSCSGLDDPTSWDCNGTCDPEEVLTDNDCNGSCDASDASGGPDCDGACLAGDVSGSPDCDGACGIGDTTDGNDCNFFCDPGDLAASADCNGSCGEFDVLGSPDCDHGCGLSDEFNSPDCDGSCDLPHDDPDGFDCDAVLCTPGDAPSGGSAPGLGCDMICGPLDQAGSPDCNGACSAGEPLGLDCDGVCGIGDEAAGIDCNLICDPGDLVGSIDCDGVCNTTDVANSIDCDAVCDIYDDPDSSDCITVTCTVQNTAACDGDCNWHEGGTQDCDGVCQTFDSVRSPDCDGLCDPGPESQENVTPDCNGWCSVFESAASSDCDGSCDQFDEGGSPDCPAPACNYAWSPVCGEQCTASTGPCDGLCGANDAGQDCNGACDADEYLRSLDCDGWCQSYDSANSPDCDGTCGSKDHENSADCNGVCEVGDSSGGPDCDEVCDPGESPSAPDCARDVTLWLTADASIEEAWVGYGTWGWAEGTTPPASWTHTPSPYLVATSPYVFSLVEQPHTLSVRIRDNGSGRAFMAALVDADGTIMAKTGDGSFRVTSVEPIASWMLPEYDDSGWSTATDCSYIQSDWETAGNGFRTIADAYAASRIWEGDTCDTDGSSSLWIRVHF